MKLISVDDIDQSQYNDAVKTISSLLHSKYPQLDLRRGTVLHDLLLGPNGILYSWFVAQGEELRNSTSLKYLKQLEESGEPVDPADVDAILANFGGMTIQGQKSKGTLILVVSADKEYRLSSGTTFSTIDGITFSVTKDVVASSRIPAVEPDTDSKLAIGTNTELYTGVSGYYFLVDVECTEVGVKGNIPADTVVTYNTGLAYLMSASSYSDFSGGTDTESISHILDRLPALLSTRSVYNNFSLTSLLTNQFKDSNFPIRYITTCGYGNPIQKRDQHNAFGVAVGGRVDAYVRNFDNLPLTTLIAEPEPSSSDSPYYYIKITPDMAPGMYAIKSVSVMVVDENNTNNTLDTLFNVKYTAIPDNEIPIYHDIHTSDSNVSEVAGTLWKGAVIEVAKDNIPGEDTKDNTSEDNTSEETVSPKFKVNIITLPEAVNIQNYVDSQEIRSLGSDIVIRCPFVCQVGLNLQVVVPITNTFNVASVKSKIASYINSTGFNGVLYRSEIVSLLHKEGVVGVDLTNNKLLYGYLYDANNKLYELYGDKLDITSLNASNALLSSESVVFCISESDIVINVAYVNNK